MPERITGTLYERDFNVWVGAQVEALRARRFEDLDLPNVVEELEDLANRNRDVVESQLARLFLHLLKARYQPEQRTPSWDKSINGALATVFKQLRKIPSLRREIDARWRLTHTPTRADQQRKKQGWNGLCFRATCRPHFSSLLETLPRPPPTTTSTPSMNVSERQYSSL